MSRRKMFKGEKLSRCVRCNRPSSPGLLVYGLCHWCRVAEKEHEKKEEEKKGDEDPPIS